MHRILIPATLLALLLVNACAPLIELEDENTALRSRLDSLEIVLAECRGQGDLLQERMGAIENENLLLDDRNRELTARMAELQYTGSGNLPLDPDSPAIAAAPVPGAESLPVQTSTASPPEPPRAKASPTPEASPAPEASPTPETSKVAEASSSPGHRPSAMPAPSYDGSVSPGLEYLRRYQTALNTYNSKQYEEAQRLFSALLAGSNANDMTDNCVYWMGEAAMQRGLTGEAIALFSNVIEYRGADKVDDALLSRASAYTREGNTAQARSDLDRLLRDFPGSEHTGMARQMLRALR